jgi:hypothetical protein
VLKIKKGEETMNLWNEGIEMLKGIHCMAEYKEQVLSQNRENPFIEAIPSRLGVDEFYDKLYSTPTFKSGDLRLEVEDRLEMVQQIKPSFWLPLPNHYDKYRGLYNMIKIGYQSRNPLLPMYNRQFAIGHDKILEGGLDENGANIAGNIQTAQSLAEIGLSGMGKSKIYERMLKLLFPQVIHHNEYKNKKLPLTQVVWLHIECPSGQSVGALCKNFYVAVDELLGSNFYEKFGEKGGNIETLAMRMAKVAAQINLGVLIIDEIQNVHKAHSGGDERVINFITGLVNTLGIPIIIMGTFKAMYLFKKSLANSRRGVPDTYSENIVSFLSEDSWEWKEFIESLWDLQITTGFTPLTDDLKKIMYFHSMGIPDIAVKLFMHVQSKAILNGKDEKISVSLINEVASKSLRLVQAVFEKIRSAERISDLEKLEDVEPEWDSFNGYLKQAEFRVNVHGKIAKDHARTIQQRDKEIILEDLVSFALNLVSNMELAEALAYQVYNASEGMGEKQGMFTQLAQLAMEANGQTTETDLPKQENTLPKLKKTPKIKPQLEENDIRFIVKQGLKKGMSTEEALEGAGLIKDCEELLSLCK